MNAKGETLRPSSAWEALPLRSSLGSSAWKPWEEPKKPGPSCWPTSCPPGLVLQCKLWWQAGSERTQPLPGVLAHWAWRHGRCGHRLAQRVVPWCPSLRWRGRSVPPLEASRRMNVRISPPYSHLRLALASPTAPLTTSPTVLSLSDALPAPLDSPPTPQTSAPWALRSLSTGSCASTSTASAASVSASMNIGCQMCRRRGRRHPGSISLRSLQRNDDFLSTCGYANSFSMRDHLA